MQANISNHSSLQSILSKKLKLNEISNVALSSFYQCEAPDERMNYLHLPPSRKPPAHIWAHVNLLVHPAQNTSFFPPRFVNPSKWQNRIHVEELPSTSWTKTAEGKQPLKNKSPDYLRFHPIDKKKTWPTKKSEGGEKKHRNISQILESPRCLSPRYLELINICHFQSRQM